MNFSNENNLNCEQTPNWKEYTIEKAFNNYNIYLKRIEKIKIQIKFTSNQKIIYSQNGAVLRVIEYYDVFEKPELFNNIDQICNLLWQGQYGKNQRKDGLWVALWDSQFLKNIGGQSQINIYILYYKDGQKQGLWKDLFRDYSNQAQILEIGEYYDDLRRGKWSYIYKDQKICGGFYNKNGQKQGQWIELAEGFQNHQVTHYGAYRNGLKVGRWDIKYNRRGVGNYKQIVGGSYDQDGNQKKIGKWVELFEGFQNNAQVTYKGEYNMNGMKIGNWDTINEESKLIGGGLYDQEGNQKKIGKWVELFEGFQNNAQLTYKGEYNMNGMKIGNWDTINEESKQIGGGSYDQEGNQKKIGMWVEIFEGFQYIAQVTFNGKYNKNGAKIGRWDIMYCSCYGDGKYRQIGGGSYDQEGDQKKIGKWVELFEGFKYNAQVTYNGEYDMYNMKIGKWDTMYYRFGDADKKQIGGGLYDQEGNQKKIGEWVELDDKFNNDRQVTYYGKYNLNGMKVGMWNIFDEQSQKIGGGSYDQEGRQIKIGKWVELDQKFYYKKQVTYNGEYSQKGRKVGKWNIMNCQRNGKENTQIGGGSYDQEGNQIKIGKWVELFQEFYYASSVTYNGEYNMNNVKIGRWDIMYDSKGKGKYKQIGGGSYDQEGNQVKIGEWVELDKEFAYNGEYNLNGIKVGRWDKINIQLSNQLCCSINFDQNGNEIYRCESELVIYVGSFKNSKKVGRWDIIYFNRNMKCNQQIYKGEYKLIYRGGGSYDQYGNQIKIGKWVELHKRFAHDKQIVYLGEYNLNQMKMGRWNIFDYKFNLIIGFLIFDDVGNQILKKKKEFENYGRVYYLGYQENNKKVGRWDILLVGNGQYELIGGGSYDQEGNQTKIGKWVEWDLECHYKDQITHNGSYNMKGQKVGIWREMNIKWGVCNGETSYDN